MELVYHLWELKSIQMQQEQGPIHRSFTFILLFLYELKHIVLLSRIMCGILHFLFRFIFIKVYIFVQQNAMDFLILKRQIPFKIEITEKLHTLLLQDL